MHPVGSVAFLNEAWSALQRTPTPPQRHAISLTRQTESHKLRIDSGARMEIAFPSVEFFRALQTVMQSDRERFKRLGYFDTTFGIRVLDDAGIRREFVLGFEVFDCTQVRASDDLAAESVDFILEGGRETWVEMLRNIQQHGAADAAHSINTLTHLGERMRVVYDDPDGHDKLYRFAESVQEFINLAAQLDIEFPAGRVAAHAST